MDREQSISTPTTSQTPIPTQTPTTTQTPTISNNNQSNPISLVPSVNPNKIAQISQKLAHKEQRLNPLEYTVFRLDGHSFSKFVRNFEMKLPFDDHFTTAMKNTALQCFDYFGFFLGFVGSDEITYALRPLTVQQLAKNGVLEFNGRVEKMVSLLAGKVSTTFFIQLTKLQGFQKTSKFTPHFDCRVFQVGTMSQIKQCISQRIKFTLKNSRMMLAQSHFSKNQLDSVPSKKAVEMLLEKGIDYNVVVHADNRVGNVLLYEMVQETKEIVVKGVQKVINFERKKCKLQNMGPKEMLEIDQSTII